MVTLPCRPFVQIFIKLMFSPQIFKWCTNICLAATKTCNSRVELRTTLEIKPDHTSTRKRGSINFLSISIQLTQNISIQIPLGENLSIQIQELNLIIQINFLIHPSPGFYADSGARTTMSGGVS